jgi:rhamnose transport system permease protein
VTIQTSSSSSHGNWLSSLARVRELGLGIFILILIFAVYLREPRFIELNNWNDILLSIAIITIVALGETLVIITHGIDLSVGSIIGLIAMVTSFYSREFPATNWAVYLLLGMAMGIVLGMLNGWIITFGKVPPIIATLGTMNVYRGLIFFFSNGTSVWNHEMSEAFQWISTGTPLGLNNMVVFAIVAAVAAYFFLQYTRTGRNVYAVGNNPDALEMVGIRKHRITFLVYTICGAACGFAGVLWASHFGSAQTNTALGFELTPISAAVVGGVSISGGVGTIPGVLLGSLLLGIIANALTIIHISPFWQLAAQGLLILIAVVIDAMINRRMQRNIQ